MIDKKRKYNKKSEYWNKFNKPQQMNVSNASGQIEPVMCGENFYVSSAQAACSTTGSSRTSGESTSGRRRNRAALDKKEYRFSNIAEGMLPYSISSDGIDVKEGIELCQKAYANVSIFRNAIDVMSEFSNSEIFLEGGSANSREFLSKWFEKMELWKLKDQYFREYFRSGNVFLYRVDGKFTRDDFKKLNKVYGTENYLKPGKIPVRYILLNPYDMVSTRSTSFDRGVYKKVLSEYEIDKLRNPKTEEDKHVFKSLPAEVKRALKEGSHNIDGLQVELDSEKLIYSFYKKQDYEPFAIPFGYSVLEDINWKMELKKIDQAVSRTIENVVLLITMGAEPEKGGINPHSLSAMQCLFQNESVGRVLVSDYTTKAQFVIPDIQKVIGPEKYEIVNQDIREGLQNIIVGRENYSSTQIKAQIFLERLKEARNAFLNDFLLPQIKLVCRSMGFRKYPTPKFQEVDIRDEVQFQRVVTRLLEIGIISPEQGVQAIRTGLFPHPDSLSEAQKKYSEERQDGFYNPLIGGVPMMEDPNASQPQAQKTNAPKEAGRPTGATASELYSRKDLQSTIYDVEKLRTSIAKSIRKKFSIKSLSEDQNNMTDKLLEAVVVSSEKDDWISEAEACIKDIEKMERLTPLGEVLEISAKHELADYPSAILYHSKESDKK